MTCKLTKRVSGEDWPLYRTSESGDCCYTINVASESRAATVAHAAEGISGFTKRSRFFDLPGDRIQFYLYFKN